MADNRLQAIKVRYALFNHPLNNPTIPPYSGGPGPMSIVERTKKYIANINAIRSLLKQWNITYNWGYDSNWWKEVPVKKEADINEWLTPQRAYQLETTIIERKSFINSFISSFRDMLNRFGGVLAWPILAPFKGAMKKGLAKKNISTSGSLADIAKRFVEHIVKKRGKPENDMSEFETAEPMSTAAIINLILQFFTMIQNGAENEDEEEMAQIAAQDAARAQALIEEERKKEMSGPIDLGSIGGLLLLAAIIYTIWRATRNGNSSSN